MEFHLLGPVEVWDGGRRLPVRGPRQRGLLGILALSANRVVPTARLVELLWPGDRGDGKVTRHRLRVQVSQLRHALAEGDGTGRADERLLFRAPGYLLRIHPGELDLDRFRDLTDRGRELLAAGYPDHAGRLLREAIGLWRGQPLEGAEPPGLEPVLARLGRRHLAAVEDRVEADLRLGRDGDDGLIAELEDLVAAQPLRERPHAQLMLALYRDGRLAEALAVYRALRDRLVDALGTEPSPPLQELQRQLLTGDPALRPPARSRAGQPAGGGSVVRPDTVTPDTVAAGTGPAVAVRDMPRQSPGSVDTVTDHRCELDELVRILIAARDGSPAAVATVDGAGAGGGGGGKPIPHLRSIRYLGVDLGRYGSRTVRADRDAADHRNGR